MEQRMTVCNMSIEAGARAGLIAPDAVTFEYLAHTPRAPQGDDFARAVARWRQLRSDEGAHFDREVRINASEVRPTRSEEHTSELQSLMRISYAVFCLKKKTHTPSNNETNYPNPDVNRKLK